MYFPVCRPISKHNNRHFGCLAILIKPELKPHIKILNNSLQDFQWIMLEKEFFGFNQDLYARVVYNPPEMSSYSKHLDYDIL